jgi:hypothetical protein
MRVHPIPATFFTSTGLKEVAALEHFKCVIFFQNYFILSKNWNAAVTVVQIAKNKFPWFWKLDMKTLKAFIINQWN